MAYSKICTAVIIQTNYTLYIEAQTTIIIILRCDILANSELIKEGLV